MDRKLRLAPTGCRVVKTSQLKKVAQQKCATSDAQLPSGSPVGPSYGRFLVSSQPPKRTILLRHPEKDWALKFLCSYCSSGCSFSFVSCIALTTSFCFCSSLNKPQLDGCSRFLVSRVLRVFWLFASHVESDFLLTLGMRSRLCLLARITRLCTLSWNR